MEMGTGCVVTKWAKLQYIGKQEWPGREPLRLWNLIAVGHPSHRSTLSLVSLRRLGVVK